MIPSFFSGLIMGMVIAVLSAGAGFLLGYRSRPRPQSLVPQQLPWAPRPVCGCDHHYCFHDLEARECHAVLESVTSRDEYDQPDTWERSRCPCRGYIGPEPLPEVFALEGRGR